MIPQCVKDRMRIVGRLIAAWIGAVLTASVLVLIMMMAVRGTFGPLSANTSADSLNNTLPLFVAAAAAPTFVVARWLCWRRGLPTLRSCVIAGGAAGWVAPALLYLAMMAMAASVKQWVTPEDVEAFGELGGVVWGVARVLLEGVAIISMLTLVVGWAFVPPGALAGAVHGWIEGDLIPPREDAKPRMSA
ncbi:MAG: hypothetical protein AAF192_16820 [Pseudomonadota bacterium]